MNSTARTVKNIVLAAGFTAVALTVSVAPAQADGPQGPGVLVQPAIVDPIPDPEPQPEPQPLPDGPGEITDEPGCTHGCGGEVPNDEVPDDKDGPHEGDGPVDEPGDNPAEDAPLDQGCFTGCDLPEEPEVESIAIPSQDVPTPTRIDAGFGDELVAAPATEQDDAADLTWLLAGGAATVLAGAGAVALARSRRTA